MNRSTRLQITDLNPHLSCILCGGYFIDATTITECVHSFCRACIVRYLETSRYCPVCEVQVHKSRPLHYIRSDKTLQDIVYKLVPGLFHNEMKRRRELYASQPPEALKESRDAEDRGECLDEKFIYSPDEIFSLSVEYGTEMDNQTDDSTKSDESVSKRRFLRCPAALTVAHLKKFIRMKYGIPHSYEVDLQYDKESLLEEYTLIDVAYIFLWKRNGPMRFYYKIFERPPKKLKSEPVLEEKSFKNEESLDSAKEPKPEVEDTSNNISPPNRSYHADTVPAVEENHTPPATASASIPTAPSQESNEPVKQEDLASKTDVTNKSPKARVDDTKSIEISSTSPNKELKLTLSKYLPTSSNKVSSSESKPAVMTVAPLTKPSSSLATTSTTASGGTITHGLYTGISIKKSPPNTLHPFTVSSHLLPPPRVPPLKLSPPRFSKLESCIRQMTPKETSSSKKSSSSLGRKSKSSKSSFDKLESKVAQLKSASIKSLCPLVISVQHETKVEKKASERAIPAPIEKKEPEPGPSTPQPVVQEPLVVKPVVQEPVVVPEPDTTDNNRNQDDDKMDLDSDLFEGPLIIAEPDPATKEDSDSSNDKTPGVDVVKVLSKLEDPEDEEIDVVDDGEADSGRGSDVSSRMEGRSLSGDDDLGSPDSGVPKTPDSERPVSTPVHVAEETSEPLAKIPKCNGVAINSNGSAPTNSECGVLDLSTCARKRSHDGEFSCYRSKPVANPAVLDKTRQTPCRSLDHPTLPAVMPHVFKNRPESNGRSFKVRENTQTVFIPDRNRPRIVIKKIGPRPERFNHHHHGHHHHHQRM